MEKETNKDIGLKLNTLNLSPTLKIGITIEYFNLDGKESNSKDLLKMYVRGELIKGALHLRILMKFHHIPVHFMFSVIL